MKQKLCFLFALLLIAIAGNAKTSKDVNGDGVTNVSDVTALVNQIIGSGNYSADVCDVLTLTPILRVRCYCFDCKGEKIFI